MARQTPPAKNAASEERLVSRNRRAHFEYELGERFEAGLVLIGSEARSLRENSADLTDAWVEIDHSGEAWARGIRIPALKHAAFGHEEKRSRKLLLKAAEIEQLHAATNRERMTLVVTRCYFKNRRAKIEVAVAKGKKHYDKRQSIKERDAKRETHDAIRAGKMRT